MSNPSRQLRSWIEASTGVLPAPPPSGVRIEQAPSGGFSLRAWHDGKGVQLCVRKEWLAAARRTAAQLAPTELFSPFGAYELARFTLPDGIGVWGPSWYYAGDAETLDPAADGRVRPLAPEEQKALDAGRFWHSTPKDGCPSFGVFQSGRLVAHAVAWPRGSGVWEIGLDVLSEAKGTGLGRAVFDAASRWILDRDGLVVATTAPWNVPSVRTLRRCGLRFALAEMRDLPAPTRVPPQTLGAPLPGAELRDYYPAWARNTSILPMLGGDSGTAG